MKIKFLIFFLTFWFATSVLIDFVAAPAIFRNISNLQEAGTLGMIIFMSFNTLEVILSLFSFGFALSLVRAKKLKTPWLILFLLLVIWAGFFRFHVSPQIVDINTKRWQLSETSKEYEALTKDHAFYHQLYVRMEGTKVILLLGALVMVFRIREEQSI